MQTTLFLPPTCPSCGDLLPNAWPIRECRACHEWTAIPEPPEPDDDIPGADPAPGRCGCCGGSHHIQRCAVLWAAIRADKRAWQRAEVERVLGYYVATPIWQEAA